MFQEAFPILTVENMETALGFYRDQLEFAETYRFPEQGIPSTSAWSSALPGSESVSIPRFYLERTEPPNSTDPSTCGSMPTTAMRLSSAFVLEECRSSRRPRTSPGASALRACRTQSATG